MKILTPLSSAHDHLNCKRHEHIAHHHFHTRSHFSLSESQSPRTRTVAKRPPCPCARTSDVVASSYIWRQRCACLVLPLSKNTRNINLVESIALYAACCCGVAQRSLSNITFYTLYLCGPTSTSAIQHFAFRKSFAQLRQCSEHITQEQQQQQHHQQARGWPRLLLYVAVVVSAA